MKILWWLALECWLHKAESQSCSFCIPVHNYCFVCFHSLTLIPPPPEYTNARTHPSFIFEIFREGTLQVSPKTLICKCNTARMILTEVKGTVIPNGGLTQESLFFTNDCQIFRIWHKDSKTGAAATTVWYSVISRDMLMCVGFIEYILIRGQRDI